MISLVRAGLGVSLVPRSAALMRLPGVRFRELTLPDAAWNIAMAWHRDSDGEPLVRRFVEMGMGGRQRTEDRGPRDPRTKDGTSDFASSRQPRYHSSTVGDRQLRIIALALVGMACRDRPRFRTDARGHAACPSSPPSNRFGRSLKMKGREDIPSASAASSPTSTSRPTSR